MANQTISNKLKELRTRAGFTQKQVYEALGISQSTFSSWEVGKSEPDAQTFLFLCKMYKVEDILFEFTGVSLKNLGIHPSWDAVEVTKAYEKADFGTKNAVRKLLDLSPQTETSRESSIDDEIEAFRQELIAEQKGTTSSASGE